MAFELANLPYAYDALEPVISARTLELHHGKHHAGYVEKLNKAIDGTGLESKTLEEVIVWAADDLDRQGVFNNAAQAWNHAFFWQCMAPEAGGEPDGDLRAAIEARFGSYDDFRKKFLEIGAGQFGSGWVWLVVDDGKLDIISTPNAETPLTKGLQPLFTCDVWEHAYYLDYQNRRPEFLERFFDELVNWDFVAEQYEAHGDGSPDATLRYQDAQAAKG